MCLFKRRTYFFVYKATNNPSIPLLRRLKNKILSISNTSIWWRPAPSTSQSICCSTVVDLKGAIGHFAEAFSSPSNANAHIRSHSETNYGRYLVHLQQNEEAVHNDRMWSLVYLKAWVITVQYVALFVQPTTTSTCWLWSLVRLALLDYSAQTLSLDLLLVERCVSAPNRLVRRITRFNLWRLISFERRFSHIVEFVYGGGRSEYIYIYVRWSLRRSRLWDRRRRWIDFLCGYFKITSWWGVEYLWPSELMPIR